MIIIAHCFTSGFKLNLKTGCFLLLLVLLHALFTISSAQAATYLDLDDEAYYILNRLEAEGIIKSGLLSAKPISRKEIVRLIGEAESNSENKNEEIRSLVEILKYRFKDDIEGTNYL